MHEMGIAIQIIKIAVDSIPHDMTDCKITAVNVEVGTMSTIVPDSLSFCFEISAKETPCSEAKLMIKKIPAVMKCNDCNLEWEIEEHVFECNQCKSSTIEIIKNCDIDIISIEMD